jgi:hypothetical protein
VPDTDPDADDANGGDRPAVEAKCYLESAAERLEDLRNERARLVELLLVEGSTGRARLKRRAAASGALANLARADPASLEPFVPELVAELRREIERDVEGADAERTATARTVRDRLVGTLARVLADSPGTADRSVAAAFARAVTADLETATLRVATRATFVLADRHPEVLASSADRLGALLAVPDPVVRAWAAGTVGRVARERPDAVAPVAADLRRLLEHEDDAVRHNAVEALATLARDRPDAVAPAGDRLHELLDHDDVAIQHNVTGTLGALAPTHPEVVVPAVETIAGLTHHDEQAVRNVAKGTLAQLARERSDALKQ